MTSQLAQCWSTAERRSTGFSLIEVIVALAVLSVAVSVYVSFYSSSVNLAAKSQNQYLASRLADEQLDAILRHPGQFLWDFPEEPGTAPIPIALSKEDPAVGNLFVGPDSTIADVRARGRQEKVFGQFRWKGQARLPQNEAGAANVDAAYYEVTVVVMWKEAGRAQQLALTSALARSAVEGAS